MRRLTRRGGFTSNLGPALAAAVILFGCSSGEKPGTAGAPAKPAAAPRKAQAGNLISTNMVSAALSARTGPANVQMKFELRERPDIAQPLDIDLAILPMSANLDRLYGKVEAGEGLELAEGAEISPTDRPAEGIPIRHSIKVLPTRNGIFTINAVVNVDAAGQSSSQTFSIPVIVGAGLPTTKPAAAAR
jgi:hypothetical protein